MREDEPAIRSIAELYAHALAIEREAAARYQEFAQQMEDHDREELARLFRTLAHLEHDHAQVIEKRSAGLRLPSLAPNEYSWLDAGPPETATHEWLFRLMTPRDALLIALAAERRAKAFFDTVAAACDDPALRQLARDMADDEADHINRVERALAREPNPRIDWDSVFADEKR